jgi:hypothetical protein
MGLEDNLWTDGLDIIFNFKFLLSILTNEFII